MEIFKPYSYTIKKLTQTSYSYTLNILISIPNGFQAKARHIRGEGEEKDLILIGISYVSLIPPNGYENSLGSALNCFNKHFKFEFQDEFEAEIRVEIDHPTYFSLPLDFVYKMKSNSSIKKLIDEIRILQVEGSDYLEYVKNVIQAIPKNYIFDERYVTQTLAILDSELRTPVLQADTVNGSENHGQPSNLWPQKIKYIISKLHVESKGEGSDIFD